MRTALRIATWIVLGAWGLFWNFTIQKPDERAAAAYQWCQQFVNQRLKTPASAKYPRIDSITIEVGGDAYRVSAHVDAQNGALGAMLRQTFECTVRPLGDGRWKLDHLTMSER